MRRIGEVSRWWGFCCRNTQRSGRKPRQEQARKRFFHNLSLLTMCDMRAYWARYSLVLTILLISPVATASGLDWLATQQNPDGSFSVTPASLATSEQATAEIALTYQALGEIANPTYGAALDYLTQSPAIHTEAISQRILVLATAGQDVSIDVELLLTHQNADGGFGHEAGYASAKRDTALALEALTAANNTVGSEATASAVSYLLAQQQSNGGWTDGNNEPSAYLTAISMRALWVYRAAYAGVATAVNDAQNFLISQRQSSNLWAEDFTSALSMSAMLPGVVDLSLLDASTQALQGNQSANSSWGDDSYTTALALRVLAGYAQRKGNIGTIQNGSLSGYVIKAGSSEPIADASVTITQIPGVTISTNSDGYFVIPGLPATTYTLSASKSGYITTNIAATVIGGQVASAGTLVLATSNDTGFVNGQIFDSADTTALAGATITLTGSGISHNAIAGTNGHFTIGAVAAGSYTVNIAFLGYDSFSGLIQVNAGETISIYQGLIRSGGYQETSPGQLSGIVINAANSLPISGAFVDLGNGSSASTDTSGEFVIAAVERGDYRVTVSAGGYVTQAYFIGYVAGASGNIGVFALYPATVTSSPSSLSLETLVIDSVTGLPLPGVTITVAETGTTVTTSIDGRALIDGLTQQSFNLAVSAFGYQQVVHSVQVSGFGSAFTTVMLSPVGDGSVTSTLSGTVTDSETGAVISGAQVAIDNGGPSTVTNVDGQYSLTNIDQLTMTVMISAAGYQNFSHNISVSSPGSFIFNPALTASAADRFQITQVVAEESPWASDTEARFSATIINLQSVDATALITGEIVNAAGEHITTLSPYVPGTETVQAEIGFGPNENTTVVFAWQTAQLAAGAYRLIVRVSEPGSISRNLLWGQVLAENSGYGEIISTMAISGGLSINPPVLSAGSSTPVQLSALVKNAGNTELAASVYELQIVDPASGTVLHIAEAEADVLAPLKFASLDFGEWIPTQSGSLEVSVRASEAGVSGVIIDTLYIGRAASGTFSVDHPVVATGSPSIKGSINLQGLDATQGGSSDPLYALVKDAVERGAGYVAPTVISWDKTNKCLGCHIQNQSLVGMASSLDKADIDVEAAGYLYNAISTAQTVSGAIYRSPEEEELQTALGFWSLDSWPNEYQSFGIRRRAASYLLNSSDHDADNNTTFWKQSDTATWWVDDTVSSLAAQGIAGVLNTADDIVDSDARFYVTTKINDIDVRSLGDFADVQNPTPGFAYFLGSTNSSVFVYKNDLSSGQSTAVAGPFSFWTQNLAVDADGTIYVSERGRIIKTTANGIRTIIYEPIDRLTRFFNMTIGADGYIYGSNSDPSHGVVWRMSKDGDITAFSRSPLLVIPGALSFGPDGSLYVAVERGIVKLSSDGSSAAVVPEVAGIFFAPRRLKVDSTGTLYFSQPGSNLPVGREPARLFKAVPGGTIELMARNDNMFNFFIDQNDRLYSIRDVVGSASPRSELFRIDSRAYYDQLVSNLVTPLRNELPRMARYFLNRYDDNSDDNIVHASRLTALAELRTVITDPALLVEINTAIDSIEILLRSRQQANGGWKRKEVNSITDSLATAQVGLALDYTNPDPAEPMVRNTIYYLLDRQQLDGSWSSETGIFSTKLGSTSLVMTYLPIALERLGGIDVDLHVTTPDNVQLDAPQPEATTVEPDANGGSHHFWALKGVKGNGQDVNFDLTLVDMVLNEQRAVASEAWLEFTNAFTGEKLRLDLEIPVVKALSDLGLGVTTNASSYQADDDVLITSVVSNGASISTNGEVLLTVRAAGGGETLALLPSLTITDLAAGAEVNLASTWNTGTTLTGDFEIHAQLLDHQGQLAGESITPFSIGAPDILATGTVVTDKAVYEGWDTVNLTGRITNAAANAVLPSTRVEVTVRAPDGSILFTDSYVANELTPDSFINVPFTMNLADAVSGTYNVNLVIKDEFTRNVLSTASNSFIVDRQALQGITGSAAVQFGQVYQGDANSCTLTTVNNSATTILGLKLTYRVVNVDQQLVVSEVSETINLDGYAIHNYTLVFDTDTMDVAGHTCLVTAEFSGADQPISFAGFQILEPPIRLEGSVAQGDRGRLLVWLDSTRVNNGASCDGINRMDLATSFVTPLDAPALAEVVLLNADGMELDRESYMLGTDLAPKDANPGSGIANLIINSGTANGFSVSLANNDVAQGLGAAVQVKAIIYADGNTLIVDSGAIATDCTPPINTNDVFGDYVLTDVNTLAVANDPYSDPYGSASAPALAEQKAFLEQLLTDNGWSYTLTESPDAFEREFHSGGYAVYALFGEAGKLPIPLQTELREAVYRGEGLLIAGPHDNRNTQSPRIVEALGLKVAGTLNADAMVVFAGPLSESDGLISLFADEKALRVKPGAAITHGNFLTTDAGNDCDPQVATDCTALTSALLTHAYGEGSSIFAGFDLLAASTRDGADSTAAKVLLNSLSNVHPVSLAPTAGSVLPLTVTVSNLGVIAETRITLTLPTGLTVIDPGTLTAISATQLTGMITIPEATQAVWTLWVKLPESAGTITINAIIEGAVPGTDNYLLQAEPVFELVVSPAPTVDDIRVSIDTLIAQGIGDKNELNKANNALNRAEKALANDAAKAINQALKAADALRAAGNMTEIETGLQETRVLLGLWLRGVARLLP